MFFIIKDLDADALGPDGKSKLSSAKKEMTMCDFLRKEKDALLNDPLSPTSSAGCVTSQGGVKRKAMDDQDEVGKRQKKESTSEQSSKPLPKLFYGNTLQCTKQIFLEILVLDNDEQILQSSKPIQLNI